MKYPCDRTMIRRLVPVLMMPASFCAFATASVFEANDTADGNIRWAEISHWSPMGVPNAPDVEVVINKITGEDRNVNLGDSGTNQEFTIGRLQSVNDSDGNNRIRRGSILFAVTTGNAEIHLSGSGEGRLEFRMDEPLTGQRVFLQSTLDTFVDQVTEDGHLRFRGSLTGPGGLTLNGPGEVRLRASDLGYFNADYTGPTIIREGMLRLRAADLTGTSSVEVFNGGQLRLDARHGGDPDGASMNVFYSLGGGTLTLRGEGREADNPALGGATGALRQHGQGTEADVATLSNPIILAEDAVIHVNSDIPSGGGVLNLEGPVSGPGKLVKTGGGQLNLSGENFFGGLEITNGTVDIQSASSLPTGPLHFTDRSSVRILRLRHDAVVSELDGITQDPDDPDSLNTLFLELNDGAMLTVDQAFRWDDEEADEVDTRFQGDISGNGGLIKDGGGRLRLTRFAKQYTGPTVIRKGVLEVSESAALPFTASITVEEGGQLRLSTSGDPAIYTFGGPVILASTGRGGDVPDGEALGLLGGLRYDPGTGEHTAILQSDVVVAGESGVHVDGVDREMVFNGVLSGNDDVFKSGGGRWVISGDSASFQGAIEVERGELSLQNGNHGGSVAVAEESVFEWNPPGNHSVIRGGLLAEAGSVVRLHIGDVDATRHLTGDVAFETGATLELHLPDGEPGPFVLFAAPAIDGWNAVNVQMSAGQLVSSLNLIDGHLIAFTGGETEWQSPRMLALEAIVGPIVPLSDTGGSYQSEWMGMIQVPPQSWESIWAHHAVLGWIGLRGHEAGSGVWPFLVGQDGVVRYAHPQSGLISVVNP